MKEKNGFDIFITHLISKNIDRISTYIFLLFNVLWKKIKLYNIEKELDNIKNYYQKKRINTR